jgi:hypothetical protein
LIVTFGGATFVDVLEDVFNTLSFMEESRALIEVLLLEVDLAFIVEDLVLFLSRFGNREAVPIFILESKVINDKFGYIGENQL